MAALEEAIKVLDLYLQQYPPPFELGKVAMNAKMDLFQLPTDAAKVLLDFIIVSLKHIGKSDIGLFRASISETPGCTVDNLKIFVEKHQSHLVRKYF